MSSKTITLPPYRAETLLTASERITPDAHRSLLQLYNASPLQLVDTTNGPANFSIPFAKNNQNVEICFLKSSADGNLPTLVTQGNDKVNGLGSIAMPTAQYSRVRLRGDGVSNWYVVG